MTRRLSNAGGILASSVFSPNMMLKKPASGVLASLRGSTYGRGKRARLGGLGAGRVRMIMPPRPQDTAGSPTRRRAQAWRSLFFAPCTSLRPRWTAFLTILRDFLPSS